MATRRRGRYDRSHLMTASWDRYIEKNTDCYDEAVNREPDPDLAHDWERDADVAAMFDAEAGGVSS